MALSPRRQVARPGRRRPPICFLTLLNIIQGILGDIAWPHHTAFSHAKMETKTALGLKSALLGPSLACAWPHCGACLAVVFWTDRGPNRITSGSRFAVARQKKQGAQGQRPKGPNTPHNPCALSENTYLNWNQSDSDWFWFLVRIFFRG